MPNISDYSCKSNHPIMKWELCALCVGLDALIRPLQQHFGIQREERTEGVVWNGQNIRTDIKKLQHPGVHWHELAHWLVLPEHRQRMPDYGFGFDVERYPDFAKRMGIPATVPPMIPKDLVTHEEDQAARLSLALQQLWVNSDQKPMGFPLPPAYAEHLRPRLDSHPVLATLPLTLSASTLSPDLKLDPSGEPSPAPL